MMNRPLKHESEVNTAILHDASPDAVSDITNGKITRKIYDLMFQGYPDVLDVKQVGELLNISTKTVYRLLNEGTLDSLKVGRAFKVPKLYLLQYIKVIRQAQHES